MTPACGEQQEHGVIAFEPSFYLTILEAVRDHFAVRGVSQSLAGVRPLACLNRSTRRSKASSSATMRFFSAATYASQFVRIASSECGTGGGRSN